MKSAVIEDRFAEIEVQGNVGKGVLYRVLCTQYICMDVCDVCLYSVRNLYAVIKYTLAETEVKGNVGKGGL